MITHDHEFRNHNQAPSEPPEAAFASGAPFSGSESLVGKLTGWHFSGLEGALLWL